MQRGNMKRGTGASGRELNHFFAALYSAFRRKERLFITRQITNLSCTSSWIGAGVAAAGYSFDSQLLLAQSPYGKRHISENPRRFLMNT